MINHYLHKNQGEYTELLVNQTINYYLNNKIAFFRKNQPAIQIQRVNHKLQFNGQLTDHGGVDYSGIYRGQYFCFEVKQTNKEVFLLTQLKERQWKELLIIDQFEGVSFLLLNFNAADEIFLVPTPLIAWLKKHKIRRIKLLWAKQHCYELPIAFPGIIDWIQVWKNNQQNWKQATNKLT